MGKKVNPFCFGSMAYLDFEARYNTEILYLMFEDTMSIKIFCKPFYNIDKVKKFIEDHIPYGIYYEIIVENKLKEIN